MSRQFDTAGTFPFYCALHPGMTGTVNVEEGTGEDVTPPTTSATFDPPSPGDGGTYTGPVTVSLSATDNAGGSGVDSITYQLDDGDETEYSDPITVSAEGAHTLRFHATDLAGNEEEWKQVTFTIASDPGAGDPGGGDGPGRDTTPPNATPFAELESPGKASLRDFLRKGLVVEGPCMGVESGKATLKAKRGVARKLGLKGTALAKARVTCGADGRFRAKLKPKGKVKRALKGAKPFKATVQVKLSGPLGSSSDSAKVKIGR